MSPAVEIPLPQGQATLVDAADLEKVSRHRWHLKQWTTKSSRIYAQTTIRLTPGRLGKKTSLALHRFIVDAKPGDVVDHVNGNTLDNRRANLRVTDNTGNSRNIRSSKRQKLGLFKGVSWNKRAGKWEAAIGAGERKPDGRSRRVYLGLFLDPADAARAYDAAALKHFGEFAALNFPDSGIAGALDAVRSGDEAATLDALKATLELLSDADARRVG